MAAGVNDTFRQAGIAVGVAALGALIPAEGVLGGGGAAAYVDGLHDALLVGAALAAVGAVAAALLIPRHFGAGAQVEDLATAGADPSSRPRPPEGEGGAAAPPPRLHGSVEQRVG